MGAFMSPEGHSYCIGFVLRNSDDPAHKISQTLEGSSVRRFGLYRFGFLPLRGHVSRRRRVDILTDQLTIDQATTRNRCQGNGETVSIIGLAIVETERLFIEVAEQMERFNAHISPLEPTLEQAPEVFNGVGVDVAAHIFNGMINDLM